MRDQRVWITGASSGIGAAVAAEFAGRGCALVLTARRLEALEEVARECRDRGASDVLVAPADITDGDAVRAVVDVAGPIDVAVLNAGTWTPMPVERFDADEVARQFEVNVVGTARCIESVLPAMRERGSGRVVIVSSLTSFTGLPLAAAYGSTKAALRWMGDSLRAELDGSGVGVTVVNPGFVRTPMTAENRFHMPGLLEPDAAARRIARAVERGRSELSFPFGLATALKLVGNVPGVVRRPIVARMARANRRDAHRNSSED